MSVQQSNNRYFFHAGRGNRSSMNGSKRVVKQAQSLDVQRGAQHVTENGMAGSDIPNGLPMRSRRVYSICCVLPGTAHGSMPRHGCIQLLSDWVRCLPRRTIGGGSHLDSLQQAAHTLVAAADQIF